MNPKFLVGVLMLLMLGVMGSQASFVDVYTPFPNFIWTGALSDHNTILNADKEACGAIFNITKTGKLMKIAFRTETVTATDEIKIKLETVDTATGKPTGTYYADAVTGHNTGAYGVQSTVAASTTYWVPINGTTGLNVTQGDRVAINLTFDSFSTGNLVIATGMKLATTYGGYPYCFEWIDGAYAKNVAGAPNFGFEYSDGITYVPGFVPASAATSVDIGTNSNPDHRGGRFKVPYNATITGCYVSVDLENTMNVVLYDSDGVTELENRTINPNMRFSSSSSAYYFQFAQNHTILADTYYRVAVVPTSATATLTTYTLPLTDDGALKAIDGMPGGQNMHLTTCTNVPTSDGSWTNSLTDGFPLTVLLSRIDTDVTTTEVTVNGIVGGRGGGRG